MQHEGDFAFKEAWFHLYDEYPVKYEADRLPPPIVADLNGDGKKEILVATNDAKIQVFFLFVISDLCICQYFVWINDVCSLVFMHFSFMVLHQVMKLLMLWLD